ncbi:DNA-binding anti-repressor SinI [Bacillus sp. JJ722]|uniref:DNA-binding anti-repressor SinI n=1 Tax=Bacillus sp. JJ722 TaxID=3122973 RepID=UPI003000D044
MNNIEEEIDKEWLLLMKEAKENGLSIQEVKSYIIKNSHQNKIKEESKSVKLN